MTLHQITAVLSLLHTYWEKRLIRLSSVVHEPLKSKCSGHKRDEVSENCTMIFKNISLGFFLIRKQLILVGNQMWLWNWWLSKERLWGKYVVLTEDGYWRIKTNQEINYILKGQNIIGFLKKSGYAILKTWLRIILCRGIRDENPCLKDQLEDINHVVKMTFWKI
jgi:hypothetical protein